MLTCGVVQIAIGECAQTEQRLSAATLPPGLAVHALTKPIDGLTPVKCSRYYKTHLDLLSPFDLTLYLDADTRVQGDISAPFDILADGWDIAMCASPNQEPDAHLWHVGADERESTYFACGFVPLQLQAGVMWFAKNDRTRAMFAAWRDEWARWGGQDQGALLRAMNSAQVRTWILGRVYNGGSVIQHLFGRARSND